VLDGEGAPVRDALVETWQADPPPGPAFRAFARCATDDEGRYEVVTLAPGPVPGPHGTTQAPHLDLGVLARGLLARVVTRVYFAEHAALHAHDPVLARVAPARRATLVARPAPDGTHRFDVRLQGEGETVFFALEA
jgi:protocatechuate 3,4-dioxygenase alpha subunit